jgi:hypothetical protein
VFAQNPFNDSKVYWARSGSCAVQTGYTTGLFYLLVVDAANGNDVPRVHLWTQGSGWTHGDGDAAVNNHANGPVTRIRIGHYAGGEFFNGILAAVGLFDATSPLAGMADATVAALGLETALQAWWDADPVALWADDFQADLTGGGADLIEDHGTDPGVSDPPGFDYTISTETIGTAVADVGSLLATASGVRSVLGAATVDLSALAGAAVGGRLVPGVAAADLVAVAGSVVGARSVGGLATSDLGVLHAAAVTAQGFVVHRPDIGTISVPRLPYP